MTAKGVKAGGGYGRREKDQVCPEVTFLVPGPCSGASLQGGGYLVAQRKGVGHATLGIRELESR